MTTIDLSDGIILLKPMTSQGDKLANRTAKKLKEENITQNDLLEALDEESEKYYQEREIITPGRDPCSCTVEE